MNRLQRLTRRRFMQGAGVTAAGLSVMREHALGVEDDSPLIIDCHAHIYGEDEEKYPTIEQPYRPPQGKGTVKHLQQEMKAAGVRYVTAIQTSTFYRWDNRFTSDSARDNKDFMIGVMTLDPDDPDSSRQLERYVKHFNVRGMRSVPAASGRLDDPGVERLWATAEQLGIVINALVSRDKRGELETLIQRHAKLRVVIDHCLNLEAGPTLEPTLAEMLALAKLPNVHAKLTFIPTGSAEAYPCRDMHDACHAVIEAFGGQRCVWGSDFPCELWCPKVTYAQHLKIFSHELGLDEATKKAILGETAHRLWFQA
ncbi:MAG: amidohydrolase family protein [Planctomycetota bacterium]|nr:amidohydrolase family protein [Planctomycetota bacterium]